MGRWSASDVMGLVAMLLAALILLTIIVFVNQDSVRGDQLQDRCIKASGEWVDAGCRIR